MYLWWNLTALRVYIEYKSMFSIVGFFFILYSDLEKTLLGSFTLILYVFCMIFENDLFIGIFFLIRFLIWLD